MKISDFIDAYPETWPGQLSFDWPWALTGAAPQAVAILSRSVAGGTEIAIDPSAVVESGATIKPPCFIGPGCFVASGAYLRDGVWLERGVTIGPACEVKSSFIFHGTKLAHFNFVGDSLIGADCNLEAGAIIANYRNERRDKTIAVRVGERKIVTNVEKFGALLGDRCRIGANAVLAPGTILAPDSLVPRLSLVDQDSHSR